MQKARSSFLPFCIERSFTLKEQTKQKKAAPVYILTGVFLLLLCVAVTTAALIVPYEKTQTYLNIVFMNQGRFSPDQGLEIVENTSIPTDLPSGTLPEEGTITRPKFGEQYAVLRCETAEMEVPVYWGSSAQLLERGACQSSATVVIGEAGNSVIDAHVNTFFANLNKIQLGDEIILFTAYGVFTYTARELVKFQNTDKKYILPTETDQLTLYTCEAQILGTSSTRIGVLCDLTKKQFYTSGEEGAE